MRSQTEQYFTKNTAKSQKLLVTNIYFFQLPNIISNICYILSTSGPHHISWTMFTHAQRTDRPRTGNTTDTVSLTWRWRNATNELAWIMKVNLG